jgi:hypothetical protein
VSPEVILLVIPGISLLAIPNSDPNSNPNSKAGGDPVGDPRDEPVGKA